MLKGNFSLFLLLTPLIGLFVFGAWRKNQNKRRAAFIDDYRWPAGLLDKLAKKRPTFDGSDRRIVGDRLRQFFLAYLRSGQKYVYMPSQAADDLWHEFILYTRAYNEFCQKAAGAYFHHTPAAVLAPERRKSNEGLRRIWFWCCKLENIDPGKPERLLALYGTLALSTDFITRLTAGRFATRTAFRRPIAAATFPAPASFDSTGDSAGDSHGHGVCSGHGCSGGCSGGCGDGD